MMFFMTLLLGVLRIVQANCNKLTSGSLHTKRLFFRYGAYFESAAAVFSAGYLCIFGFSGLSTASVVCSVLTAFCYVTELITSLEALKRAPLVLCNMCAMGGGIILASVAGIFVFGEPMSLLQWLGVAVFFAAAYCLSPGGTAQRCSGRLSPAAGLLLAANFLINGAASFLSKYYAVRVEGGNAALYSCLTYACSALLFALLVPLAGRDEAGQPRRPFPKKLLLYGGILGLTCASLVSLITMLSRVMPVVVLNTVPSAISIIGCLFVGAWLFGEKITGRNLCGVLLGILSVVLIVCK